MARGEHRAGQPQLTAGEVEHVGRTETDLDDSAPRAAAPSGEGSARARSGVPHVVPTTISHAPGDPTNAAPKARAIFSSHWSGTRLERRTPSRAA